MAEYVIIWQNSQFETEFRAQDPHDPDPGEPRPVVQIHQLTPYTMLLSSLGACTAIVVNTYAQNHDVKLQEIELHLRYERVFQDDCENCEHIDRYDEQISQRIILTGDLSDDQRDKLFFIAQQCSIHKMMESGIKIYSQLGESAVADVK